LWSSQITAALDKVVDAMAKIGHTLPQFEVLMRTFQDSDAVKAILALFYEDILDFYCITFDFFRKAREYNFGGATCHHSLLTI
jgi:hypothetical protein